MANVGPLRAMPELDAGPGRTGKRVVKAVSKVLPRVLTPGENVSAVVEAFEVVGWRQRVLLGSTWALTHRVALVFTERRLLEVALSIGGRTATGFIREYPWASASLPKTDKDMLVVAGVKWLLRRRLQPALLEDIRRFARSENTQARRSGGARSWRLCPKCGATWVTVGGRCQRCGELPYSAKLASWLAVAFPGAGLYYLGRPGFAALRVAFELACLAVVGRGLLNADGRLAKALLVTLGLAVLILVKTESMTMTKALAGRTGTTGTSKSRRWPQVILGGALASVFLGALPVFLAGKMSSRITADLDAEAGYMGWSVQRLEPGGHPGLRAQWRHRDGWLVEASATPYGAFAGTGRVRRRWLNREGAETELLELAEHKVVRVLERSGEDGGQWVLKYVLFDDYGRDVHELSLGLDRKDAGRADAELQKLIPCLYWVSVASE
jgi:hypothetical protein